MADNEITPDRLDILSRIWYHSAQLNNSVKKQGINMDQLLAESLSRQLKIALEHVVREEYELLLLRSLMETSLGSELVLKGGTALRLAYDSARFSDDLDFSLLAPVAEEDFQRAAEAIARVAPQ